MCDKDIIAEMSGNGKIKAIETVYSGYRFRSRLEARWAVFFDAIGVEYHYEPEGFDLQGTWYLPDFYIPTWDSFVEIKGSRKQLCNASDIRKCRLLNRLSDKKVIIFVGNIKTDILTVVFLPVIFPDIIRNTPDLNEIKQLGLEIDLEISQKTALSIRNDSNRNLIGLGTFAETKTRDRLFVLKCTHQDGDKHKTLNDFSTIAYFPLNKHFSFPESFSRKVKSFSGGTPVLDRSRIPTIHSNDETIGLFASYNARIMHNQKLITSRYAYLAARQARFEHGQTPRYNPPTEATQ